MADLGLRHRLLSVDAEARRGYCARCGPVEIRRRGGNRYRCANAVEEQNARLTQRRRTRRGVRPHVAERPAGHEDGGRPVVIEQLVRVLVPDANGDVILPLPCCGGREIVPAAEYRAMKPGNLLEIHCDCGVVWAGEPVRDEHWGDAFEIAYNLVPPGQ